MSGALGMVLERRKSQVAPAGRDEGSALWSCESGAMVSSRLQGHSGSKQTFSAPNTSASVSESLATTLPRYIRRIRSVEGWSGIASWMRARSSRTVVEAASAERVNPPSELGWRTLRLIVRVSSAMVSSE